MKTLTALSLAVTLTGCSTTLGELRASAPVRSTVVAKSYRPLALCTFDGASTLPRNLFLASPGNDAYQVVDYQPDTRIAVIGLQPPNANVELMFTQETVGTARVEMRFGFSDGISRRRYERELWGVVESCAKATPSAAR